jgi:hypothetical protein
MVIASCNVEQGGDAVVGACDVEGKSESVRDFSQLSGLCGAVLRLAVSWRTCG